MSATKYLDACIQLLELLTKCWAYDFASACIVCSALDAQEVWLWKGTLATHVHLERFIAWSTQYPRQVYENARLENIVSSGCSFDTW